MGPHRVNIINVLQLIASMDHQLNYQRNAPVNVASEVVNQWFGDFYHPGDERFRSEFTAAELNSLADFNKHFDLRIGHLPDTLAEMLEAKAWLEVVAAAGRHLKDCNWNEIQARYEQ
jgi:hypothetical protein